MPFILKSKKRSKRRLATLAACCLAAVLLDGLCWGARMVLLPHRWEKNSKTGRLFPGFHGSIDYTDVVEGRGARLGTLSVNSLGLRGTEPKLSSARSPNRLRIYCLGASTTFGWGATSDTSTYPAQLEKILIERYPNYELEVINAGIPGNPSATELKILKVDLPRLHPDVVILWSGWIELSLYYKPVGSKPPRDTLSLLRKSNTFRVVEYVRDNLTPRTEPPTFESLVARPGLTSFRQNLLLSWRKNLETMIDACAQENASMVLLGLASPLRHPVESWNSLTRHQASKRLFALPCAAPADLPKGLQDFEHELKDVAEKSAGSSGVLQRKLWYIPAENLPDKPDLFSDGVHMKDNGYAALAEAVAAQLDQKLILKHQSFEESAVPRPSGTAP